MRNWTDEGDMPGRLPTERRPELTGPATIAELVDAIESEFAVALGNADRVAASCRILDEWDGSKLAEDPALARLIPLPAKRGGKIALPVYDLLEGVARTAERPGGIVQGLLRARDRDLSLRALWLMISLVEDGRVAVDMDTARMFASLVDTEGSVFDEPVSHEKIARLLRMGTVGAEAFGIGPLAALYLEGSDLRLRRLAARLLDLPGTAVPRSRAERLLGMDAYRFLKPVIEYAGASHRDLLDLAWDGPLRAEVLESFMCTEILCGERLMREIMVALGWARLNGGIETQDRESISIDGAYPLYLSSVEASLFDGWEAARRIGRRFLIIAHGSSGGGNLAPSSDGRRDDDRITCFRGYNLAHAEALSDILDAAPLTPARLRRILDRMDRIVTDFVRLFAEFDGECATLPAKYEDLRGRVLAGCAGLSPDVPLPADAMRVALAFEDPVSLGDVHTLHGLKRYLHQKGLRLGFRLVERGGATNRTCDIVLTSTDRVLHVCRKIQYVDFEPDSDGAASLPLAVRLLVDGFALSILNESRSIPDVKVFCYGNEVHYYVSYGTHPAFLRIDYGPPLRGGMIDLEYYGVSKSELAQHPQPSLDAVRRFFRRLDFDCKTASTHVQARYDKERALDLADICDKAESLFRLLPHLMEIDWVIGSMDLDPEAREKIASAWAEFFVRWGALPFDRFLTSDRTGILMGLEPTAAGSREVRWSGRGHYEDSVAEPEAARLVEQLGTALALRGFERSPVGGTLPRDGQIGQAAFERAFLAPLRAAIERGEAIAGPGGITPASSDLYRTDHETERFAADILGGDAWLDASIRLASIVAPLERTLRFRTTGSVNGFETQSAPVPLGRRSARLYVLRDGAGMIRLALFAQEGILYRRRPSPDSEWSLNAAPDDAGVEKILRRHGYSVAGTAPAPGHDETARAAVLRDLKNRKAARRGARRSRGERVVPAIAASPGRAVGRVLFGTEGRKPEDLEGAILVSSAIRPEDNTHLYRAAGIVSTSGGILSHAGLLALQFRKPAMMIQGRWETGRDGLTLLGYPASDFIEEEAVVSGLPVVRRTMLQEREEMLREGDLVVLDVEEQAFRVLGQEAEPLALHDELRRLREAGTFLDRATDMEEILDLRGRRLRARYMLERLLTRMRDPAIACHAVRELLNDDSVVAGGRGERAKLLSVLAQNPAVGADAREEAADRIGRMKDMHDEALDTAGSLIPESEDEHEILALRLDVVRRAEALIETAGLLGECGWAGPLDESLKPDPWACDRAAAARLGALREEAIARITSVLDASQARRLVRRIERIESVLPDRAVDGPGGVPGTWAASPDVIELRERIAREDCECHRRLAGRTILTADDGGLELVPLVGSKAANLAEVARIVGSSYIPRWFVVTDAALRAVLDARLSDGLDGTTTTPREVIDSIASQAGMNPAQKAFLIRKVWDGIRVPEAIADEIVAAYRSLAVDVADPSVAVRSSGLEEDVLDATRAGEFETFLFISGAAEVIAHVKRVWGSFWTERAIHNRVLFGGGDVHGGVLVQRIARSRVSGVIQTVNAAEEGTREIIVNAGLGMGEGIVSGAVGADLIVISKERGLEAGAPLRMRYITNDKREKVVFNEGRGGGTIRVEALYHERFRPALEYAELAELARVSLVLERSYAMPLDIEFGVEGSELRLLQVRPVATTSAVLRDTAERRRLRGLLEWKPGGGMEVR
jgi:phosphohistidine swiveling domain-containing protein